MADSPCIVSTEDCGEQLTQHIVCKDPDEVGDPVGRGSFHVRLMIRVAGVGVAPDACGGDQ